ncbi:uncharacterized protein CEXT_802441 [Caerostris extrusa]|uniref:Uncharacterized protein n=1 Tax=Caerostris extrusa TaxID=172846 RepID=A0AAV4RDX1_CAEEX|nr:uncharacterized protein CEXT_802441 [Caerostris extrusa]
MASTQFSVLTVLIICLSMTISLCVAQLPKKKDTAIMECVDQQMCQCELVSRFDKCYQYLTDETKIWFVDQINACEIEKVDPDAYTDGVRKICTHDREEIEPCFDDVNKKLMERVRQSATGQFGPDETKAFEEARVCQTILVINIGTSV